MASQASIDQVQKIYIAYYGRPADPGGLEFWASKLDQAEGDLTAVIDAFATSTEAEARFGGLTSNQTVTVLYNQLFGRNPEPGGLAYWVDQLDNNPSVTPQTVALQLLDGARNQDAAVIANKFAVANNFTAALDTSEKMAAYAGQAAVNEGVYLLSNVGQSTDPSAVDVTTPITSLVNQGLFTLADATFDSVTVPVAPPEYELVWGYNDPGIGDDNWIPVDELVAFLESLTGLDFAELGLIDDDGIDDFGESINNVTIDNLNASGSNSNAGDDSDPDQNANTTVTITFNDGSSFSAEAQIADSYLEFLGDLLFDADGNSRLYMREVDTGSSVTIPGNSDPYSILLTPSINETGDLDKSTFGLQGISTIESGFTSAVNSNTIVAGRTELIHQAYIDGGGGDNNTLEVDLKGVFAQPAALLNIQTVVLNNMPNLYTSAGGNTYPDLADPIDPAKTWSAVDLSRALDLELLVVTEGGGVGQFAGDLGALTVMGVRNGAITRLEGNFTQDVNITYGAGQLADVYVELAVGDVLASLNIAHNSDVMTLFSDGVINTLDDGYFGGSVSILNIDGPARLQLSMDLDSSFRNGLPALIDASFNTGGIEVTLTHDDAVTVHGTGEHDDVTVNHSGDETVLITSQGGDDQITVSGDADSDVEIYGGSGDSEYTVSTADNVTLLSGDGDDTVNVTGVADSAYVGIAGGDNEVNGSSATAFVTDIGGDGDNTVDVSSQAAIVTILGAGDNDVETSGVFNVVTLGDGSNSVESAGGVVSATAGSGGNSFDVTGAVLTVTSGDGDDSLTIEGNTNLAGEIDNGPFDGSEPADAALVTVDLGGGENTITSNGLFTLAGSSISGDSITMLVEDDTDVTGATLSGVVSVGLDAGADFTVTADQFSALGASAFYSQDAQLKETAEVTVVVMEDTTLSDLVDLEAMSEFVKINIILMGDVTLTLSAEELHKYIADDGINVAADGVLNGNVVITDAGLDFDPFTQSPTGGGTLSPTFAGSEDLDIIYTPDGYSRPLVDDSTATITIDSGEAGGDTLIVTDDIASVFANTLVITGGNDVQFDGASIDLGANFVVNFASLVGTVEGMLIEEFEDVAAIRGNGTGTRIDVALEGTVGAVGVDKGLNSSGVATYVVVDLDSADQLFYVCDLTQGLEVLGLQQNYGFQISFLQVNHGVSFLLEGDGTVEHTLKVNGDPRYSNIGELYAEYFADGADAVVNVNNRGTELDERDLRVEGITVDNADTLTVNVTDGDARIEALAGNSVDDVVITGTGSVTILGDFDGLASLDSFDASGVAGLFTYVITDAASVNNLAGVTIAGVDAIVFAAAANMTLTVDQAIDIISIISGGAGETLNFTELAEQEVDFTSFEVDNLGSVEFSEGDTITVNSGTVFGNATTAVNSLEINANTSDTTVIMSVDQFDQLTGAGTVTEDTSVDPVNGGNWDTALVLTGLGASDVISTAGIDAGIEVTIQAGALTATDDLSITGGTAVTLEFTGGDVDLTEVPVAQLAAVTAFLVSGDDVTITMTAAQLAALAVASGTDSFSNFVATGANVTINITELTNEALDLDDLAANGFNIGNLSVDDTGGVDVTLGLLTMGDADSISTPDDDQDLNITADQFDGLSGAGTITGPSPVNITDIDSDAAEAIDTTGVETKGELQLSAADQIVTFGSAAVIAGFSIELLTNQEVRLSTEVQADGTEINVVGGGFAVDAGIVDGTTVTWLFDTIADPVNTDDYDTAIDYLKFSEDLDDGQNLEDIYTQIGQGTIIQNVNTSDLPLDVLISQTRTKILEAFTGLTSLTIDESEEFRTISAVDIELQGNVNLGSLLLDDSLGEHDFQSLTVYSTEVFTVDGELSDGINPGPAHDEDGVIGNNVLGSIGVPAGSTLELTDITIDTGFANDGVGSNNPNPGSTGAGDPVGADFGDREGKAIEVGTVGFNTAGTSATLTLTGSNDIEIGALDIDGDIEILTIDASGFDYVNGDLEIGGLNTDAEGDPIVANVDTIYVLNDYDAGTTALGTAGNDLVEITGGTVVLDDPANLAAVEAVHVQGDATITVSAASIAGNEGKFTVAAGVNVTINVIDLDGTAIDLDVLEAAGFNIGTVTTVDADVTLDAATTLGNADSFVATVDTGNWTVEMTAAQYQGLAGAGTVTESDGDDAADNTANILITELAAIASATTGEVTIDFSGVSVTGTQIVELAALTNAADVTLADATDLGDFSVRLDSQGATQNTIAGQIIRFANAEQAEREVIVLDTGEGGTTDFGTAVVWLFNTITGTATAGKVDTSDYDPDLGRVFMLESLVSDQNVEELYTDLFPTIIIRVVNEDDLDTILEATDGFNRIIEIESLTTLGALTFNDIDEASQPFDFVETLRIDLGGEVDAGDFEVSNVLAAPISNDDEFLGVTVNSYSPNGSDTFYLLPELPTGTDWGNAPGEVPLPTGGNEIGDIQSGSADFDMSDVTFNTFTAGTNGVALTVGTVFLSQDGDDTDDGIGNIDANGDFDVTLKAIDTTDADITTLAIDLTGLAGAFVVTGGSPALRLGANTTAVTIDQGTGTITFGSADTTDDIGEFAGIYAPGMNTLTVNTAGAGDTDLGILTAFDDTVDALADPALDGFDFVVAGAGTGTTTLTVGEANVDGTDTAPTLADGETWTFTNNSGGTMVIEIGEGTVVEAGGTLTLASAGSPVQLLVDETVDLSVLGDGLVLGNATIEVSEGQTLTLTAEQADGVTITGAGTVIVTGVSDYIADNGGATPDLSNIFTTNQEVNLAGEDADLDTGTLQIEVDSTGNVDLTAANLGIATVNVTGTGTVTMTGNLTAVDRTDDDTANPEVGASFVMAAGSTLSVTAAQANGLNSSGAGTTTVADIGAGAADADYSGIATTTATAAVDTDITFTGDFGTLDLVIDNAVTLTVGALSIISGLDISGEGGSLQIDGDGSTNAEDGDLSGVSVTNVTLDEALVVGTITWPTLVAAVAGPPAIADQVLNISLAQAIGQTISGAGGTGGVINVQWSPDDTEITTTRDTDDDDDVDAFSIAGLTAGDVNLTISSDGAAADGNITLDSGVNLGTADIILDDQGGGFAGVFTLTLTGDQADGRDITGNGNLNLVNIDGDTDLTGIAVTGAVTTTVDGGTADLSGIAGLTQIEVTAASDLTLAPNQFGALNAGAQNFAAEIANLDSLTVSVILDDQGNADPADDTKATFDVDVSGGAAALVVSGSAAAIAEAIASQTDPDDSDDTDAVSAGQMTTNVFVATTTVTHTNVGASVTSASGAQGTAGDDTFEWVATVPGTTTAQIRDFTVGTGNDVLDFSAFLGAAPGNLMAVRGDADTADYGNITGNVARFHGAGLNNAGDLEDAIQAGFLSNEGITIDASGKAIIITAVDQNAGTNSIFYVNDANGNGAIDDGEIQLVGTLTNVDIDNFVNGNF